MIVVVTALIGPTETLNPPRFQNPNVRYICFTDRADVSGWERCHWFPDGDQRRAARQVKTSPSEADITIWQDASFDLLLDPVELAAEAAKTGCQIVGFRHPDRTRIRDEAEVIIKHGMASRSAVERQIGLYQLDGFDTDAEPQASLTTTGLLVRWNTPAVAEFNRLWWEQIEKHTLRDQLSIDYCAWKTGLKIGYLPGHYRDNAYVKYNRERHRQRRAA